MPPRKVEDKEDDKVEPRATKVEKKEVKELERHGTVTNFHVIEDGDTTYVTVEAQFDGDEKHISTIYHVLETGSFDREAVQLGGSIDIYYNPPEVK